MSDDFDPSLKHVAKELAPLQEIGVKKLPVGLPEEDALRLFLGVNADLCPILAHLPDYGFDLEATRRFLSAFAGHRIEVPARRTLSRAWEDFQIWLALENAVASALPDEPLEDIAKRVATRYGSSKRRVLQIQGRFKWAQEHLIPSGS